MSSDLEQYVSQLLEEGRMAARSLAVVSRAQKDAALRAAADLLMREVASLQAVNAEDCREAESAGLSRAMVDRLRLTGKRIGEMAEGLRNVAMLPDPVGEIIAGWVRPNGLRIEKVRVPIGVIAVIYEARPNVTADAAALCLKSGNAVILRGGKEALRSNVAIHRLLVQGLRQAGLDERCIQLIDTPDRAVIDLLAQAEGKLDLIIPRGGEGLIRAVMARARVPVIKHYKGVCHTYVDAEVDLDLALKVCMNAKVQRPAVCNAMETLLVHEKVAPAFLPQIAALLRQANCQLRGCPRTRAILGEETVKAATEEDWYTEYNDLILNIRVVASLDEAVAHIAKYGSAHSDAICTTNLRSAEEFCRRVDSSAVFVNTSTRFNDGGEFGFGAEIGISTDKLHARGPMALPELTTYKYIVRGDGQVRA